MSWRVRFDGLNALYRRLQDVADRVKDQDQALDEPTRRASFDPILSTDDMTLSIVHEPKMRHSLFFVEAKPSGKKVKHTSFNDLALFYTGLVWLDEQDGALDGVISSAKEFIEVPIITNPMVHRVEQYRKGVFSVEVESRGQGRGYGTAWIVGRKSLGDGKYKYTLVSNAHVLNRGYAEEMRYLVWNADRSKRYDIEVMGVDHTADVGVATMVTPDKLPVLRLADRVPEAGSPMAILGNQHGRGIVYTAGGINNPRNYAFYNPFPVVHYDASSSNGNSGSPVFDDQARVIGMHFQGDKRGSANIGFAIPIYIILDSCRGIHSKGEHRHGGQSDTSYSILTKQELRWMGATAESGYYISRVFRGSEEEKAGLRPGHILLAVDGRSVPPKDWQAAEYQIFQKKRGEEVELTVTTVAEPTRTQNIRYRVEGIAFPQLATWETPLDFAVTAIDEITARELLQTYPKISSQGVVIRIPGRVKAMLHGVPNYAVILRLNDRSFQGVKGFRRLLEEELRKGKSVVADVLGTRRSQIFPGRSTRILLSGLSKSRMAKFEKAGFQAVALSEEEQRALGVKNPTAVAYYVSSVDVRSSNPMHGPLFIGDVLVQKGGRRLDALQVVKGKRIDLREYLKDLRNREVSEWTLWRNGKRISITREVQGEEGELEEISHDPYSFKGHTLTPQIAERLGMERDAQGVYVELASNQRSRQHPYKLNSGMVIRAVNGKSTPSKEELKTEISRVRKSGKVLILEVMGNYHWGVPDYQTVLISQAHYRP